MSKWLYSISPTPSTQPASFPAKSLSGSMQTTAGWIEPKRCIYDHELVLIREGRYKIEIEGKDYSCNQNEYIIIPPNRTHTSICLQAGRRDYAHFDWSPQTRVAAETPVMTFYPAQPKLEHMRPAPKFIPVDIQRGTITSPSIIFSLMNRLNLMLSDEHPHERLAARGVLLELLIRLLDPQTMRAAGTHYQESLAHRVRTELDKAMASRSPNFSVCKRLGNLGYSYEHLSRVFRKQYGLTPNEYVQSIRIERAKDLLRHTDLIIAAIADSVGYADPVYFSRLFKRHTGISPGKFRGD